MSCTHGKYNYFKCVVQSNMGVVLSVFYIYHLLVVRLTLSGALSSKLKALSSVAKYRNKANYMSNTSQCFRTV